MRQRYWLGGVKVLVLVAAVVLMFGTASAQVYKYLPTLSLVKLIPDGAADVTQRDTIYVAEATPGDRRYFLLPVFYKNNLDSVTNGVLTAEPIYSFRFKLQYNHTMMRAIGVQKRGVLPSDTIVGAKDFNLSFDVDRDSTYKMSTEGSGSAYGERIMIEGSSATPLPRPKRFGATGNTLNDLKQDVLLYILFEITAPAAGAPGVGISTDRLILTPDSIQWNNYVTTNPFPQLPGRPYVVRPDMVARGFDPNPNNQVGIDPVPLLPLTYPNKYGQAVISITRRPIIRLLASRPDVPVTAVDGDSTNYELTFPMQTYFGNLNYIFRNLLIRNNTPNSVLRFVTIETDQPWLRVDTEDVNNVSPGGTPPGWRGMDIRLIPETQMNFNIIANPSLLPTVDGNNYPAPGIYVGYISIRSAESGNSVLRLRVVLIVNRNPLEFGLDTANEPTRPFGIQLLFRNSAPTPDSTYLFFGTGIGARDSVDTLFGEREGGTPPSFYARFFPPSIVAQNPGFRGLVDTRGVNAQLTGRPSTNGESSLDIRGFNALSTLLYCIRFRAGTYPAVFEYDTRDFPNGAQLYFRDTLNGGMFSQNLRTSTSLGGTRQAFFVRDPNITSLCIEYTLPSLVQFPALNIGWNFVSVPVRPSDPRSGIVFENISSGKPLSFAAGVYLPNDTVRAGVGYWVKYQDELAINRDRRVAGVPIRQIPISAAPDDQIQVEGGWNTLGALSVPSSVSRMSFRPITGGTAPVIVGEVYRYRTDSGYQQTSLVLPGFGYWVKMSGRGYYTLTAPAGAFDKASRVNEEYRVLNRLTVSSADQKVGTLWFGQGSVSNERFELPPTLADMFDVRFDNNSFVSASREVAAERTVSIQGVEYPVVLAVDRSDANYTLTDANTGRVLGTFTQGQAGSVTVTDPSVTMVKLVGRASAEMNLGEAMPNPVGSVLHFTLNAPADEPVKVTLHSAIGAQVATLFNGTVKGQEAVSFDTDGLPAGVYYYKMTTATGYSAIRQVVIAR